MADDFQFEKQVEKEQDMYNRGKELANELSKIDQNNPFDWNNFTEELSEYDAKCLALYEENQNASPAPLTNPEPASAAQQTPAHLLTGVQPSNDRLSDVVAKYIDWNTSKNKPWKDSTIRKIPPQLNLFVQMVGNPYRHELTPDLMRDGYAERIHKIPAGVNNQKKHYFKGDKRKPIDEVIAIGEKINAPKLKAVADHTSNVTTFLKWASRRNYIQKDLDVVLEDLNKQKTDTENKEKAFTPDDLKKLFETEEYRKGLLWREPHKHWSPLLALYTGAREGEICQLMLEDITYDEPMKSWVIDFNPKHGTLKNKYSARSVPVHKDLVAMGFIDYVKELQSRKEKQLFPKLKPNKSGNWGREVSRWFNGYSQGRNKPRTEGYKEKCGVVESEHEVKNFHSFRHTVIDYFKQVRDSYMEKEIVYELTGHSTGKKTVHEKTYEGDFKIDRKKKTINKLKFDIDIASIRKWRKR
ncbi:MAG: site-specific integrase [Candidatus Thiodiazotropha sp.]